MTYDRTLTSAKAYAERGQLEEWIHLYLNAHGNNPAFSQGLKICPRTYLGPVKAPLSLFRRCCGPEEGMRWRIPAEHFENRVNRMMEIAKTDPEIPPLIVHYLFSETDGKPAFELNEGNDRFEAYKRLGMHETPVIVWITEKAELERFMADYGSYVAPQKEADR